MTEVSQDQITSPKQSPTKKELDTATQALNHFAQGRRHLLVNDIQSAVNSLQEACKLLAEQYGETAPECGDAYYHYGKALLELARIENGVLGNALDGVPEGEDADCSQVEDPEKLTVEEKEEVSKEVGDALEENYQTLEPKKTEPEKVSTDEKVGDKPAEQVEDKVDSKEEDTKMEEGETSANEEPTKMDEAGETAVNDESEKAEDSSEKEDDLQKKSDSDEKSTEEEEEGEGDDDAVDEDAEAEGDAQDETKEEEGEQTADEEEEVGNLQLAWEVLDLAKVIYEKQLLDKPEMSLKIAEVHLKLGEVALEDENYGQSIQELEKCLEIQTKKLEPTDRCLAETHYQMGVAHSFSDDFDKALTSFRNASKVLEDRIVLLKEQKDDPNKKENPDAFYSEEAEIEELQKLLPDIQEKITDMTEMKKDSDKKIQKAKASAFASMLGGSVASFGEGSSDFSFGVPSTSEDSAVDKSVSNITHLVRKKRKPDDEPAGNGEVKKAKGESGEPVVLPTNDVKKTEVQEGMEISESMDEKIKTSTTKTDKNEDAPAKKTEIRVDGQDIDMEPPNKSTESEAKNFVQHCEAKKTEISDEDKEEASKVENSKVVGERADLKVSEENSKVSEEKCDSMVSEEKDSNSLESDKTEKDREEVKSTAEGKETSEKCEINNAKSSEPYKKVQPKGDESLEGKIGDSTEKSSAVNGSCNGTVNGVESPEKMECSPIKESDKGDKTEVPPTAEELKAKHTEEKKEEEKVAKEAN